MADASWVSGVVSAQEARINDGGLLSKTGPGALDVRTGVMAGPGSLTVVTGTAATGTMTVNVAAHHWVTSRGASNGPYRGAKETTSTLTIAAAPGSNSRIDVVWAKMQDNTTGVPSPDAAVGEQYGVTTGTAAASPTKPAIPVGAVELATVQIAAGTTSTTGAGATITNTALQVVAAGAPVPVRNAAERNALTTYNGLTVYRLDTGVFEYVNAGGSWGLLVPATADTGWSNIPAPENAFVVGGDGARYKVRDGVCYFQIHVTRAAWTGNLAITTLPVGARPPYTHWYINAFNNAGLEVKMFASGVMTAAGNGSAGGVVVSGSFPVT